MGDSVLFATRWVTGNMLARRLARISQICTRPLLYTAIPCQTIFAARSLPTARLVEAPTSFWTPALTRAYSSAVKEFNLADVGEGISECEVLKWYVEVGKEIQQFDMICEVQSDKATAEITSPYEGTITRIYYEVGDMAKVGTPLVDIKVTGEDAQITEEAIAAVEETAIPPPSPDGPEGRRDHGANSEYQTLQTRSGPLQVLATPAVRRIAKEHNVNLADVRGTGHEGRILKHDILAFLDGEQAAPTSPAQSTSSSSLSATQTPAAPVYQAEDREVPVKGIKKIMVKSMTAACQIPHFGYCDDMIVNQLKTLREQLKPLAAEQGIKLSYLPFIIKAASLALKSFPDLNAYTNEDCSVVTLKGSHNVGVAMDTPNGLIVPNIKNVQDLSLLEIAQELNTLQALGAQGKLEKKHLEGGTFTLSNVGAIGGTYASPVLFLPQVAIGALGKIQTLPRFDDAGQVYAAHIIPVSWSADHRVIDGATMARFSNLMKNYVEQPSAMLLAMK